MFPIFYVLSFFTGLCLTMVIIYHSFVSPFSFAVFLCLSSVCLPPLLTTLLPWTVCPCFLKLSKLRSIQQIKYSHHDTSSTPEGILQYTYSVCDSVLKMFFLNYLIKRYETVPPNYIKPTIIYLMRRFYAGCCFACIFLKRCQMFFLFNLCIENTYMGK